MKKPRKKKKQRLRRLKNLCKKALFEQRPPNTETAEAHEDVSDDEEYILCICIKNLLNPIHHFSIIINIRFSLNIGMVLIC